MRKLFLFTLLTLSVGLWAQNVGDSFEDETSGLKFEITAVGETNTVKVIPNSYTGTTYTIPTTVMYQSTTFNVTEIGTQAFEDCSNLRSICLQEGLTSIGESAFNNCQGMSELTIPSTVSVIGNRAFADCTGLTKLTVKAGSIGSYAFHQCHNLQSLDLQEGVTSIGESAFEGAASQMRELILPGTVTSIGNSAFNDWRELKSLTIKAGNIGNYAFKDCYNLSSITFGNGVTGIKNGAFDACPNVASVTFLGVVVFDKEAFKDFGTATSPVALTLPAYWPLSDKPVDSATPWHGGYFNCKYTDPLKEFLGEMGEPCTDCHAVEVKRGDKVVTLYAPESVKYIKK